MPGDPPVEGVVWPWLGPTHKDGYGVLQCNGTFVLAHRFSYAKYVGLVPDGLVVRHKNDTPIDVNPNNLEIGTVADNNADMYERGRERHIPQPGESNGGHRLTEPEVLEIRRLRNECGWKLKAIADLFKTQESHVSAIARGKAWRHLTG